MIDMHYDLLTKLYMCYKQNNFSFIEKFIKNYNKDNVKGLIANMCFMSIDEMKKEYDPNYYNKNVSVVEMFEVATSLLKKYLSSDIAVLTSIEGCDFLEIEDLVTLKQLGLNAILPVWNNENKYGSGNRSKKGLTIEGEKLIKKAIELNIGIDLSHANEQTFYDIIDIVKEYRQNGIYPIIYASHSNVRSLCDIPRNLNDKQIKTLTEVDGIIGLMSNCNFVLKDSLNKKQELKGSLEYNNYINALKDMYINHIMYVQKLIGNINNIAVSTDDMRFCTFDSDYNDIPIYDYETINYDLRDTLSKYYDKNDIDKIMHKNALRIFNSLNPNEKKIINCKGKKL